MRNLCRSIALVGALALPQAAHACQCVYRGEAAGFIHASLKSLPSNARGVLFLPPVSAPTAAATGTPASGEFEITSDRVAGPLPVELSYPEANGSRLVRVGVKGGFKHGASYTIRYLGTPGRWAYPASVALVIDTQPLDVRGARYGLVLDGAPVRQMLPFLTRAGSCSTLEAAAVQDFHFEMPASYQPYRDAVMFFSESRREASGAQAPGQFEPIAYASSLCERDRFGKTARAEDRDLLHVRCDAKGARYSVRGWAGLLEVEDRLQETNAASVDFDTVHGNACTRFGILKNTLQGGDAKLVKQAVCAVGRSYQGVFTKLTADDVPSFSPLLDLAASADVETQQCSLAALSKLFMEAPGETGDLMARFGEVLERDLRSADGAKVDRAVDQLVFIRRSWEDGPDGPVPMRREALYVSLLPAMEHVLVRRTPAHAHELARLVASLGPKAAAVVPALWEVAEARGTRASAAIIALAGIVPDDPRLHDLLIRSAEDPALREAAAFAFADTAGRTRPDEAVALLMQLARDGNQFALDRLAKFGRGARTSIPMLLDFVVSQKNEWARGTAFSALLAVSDEEPEVMAAIIDVIAAPKERAIPMYRLAELKKFEQRARIFLPAIEKLMLQPRQQDIRYAIEPVIRAMELPCAQQDNMLARAAQITSAPLSKCGKQ